jgi:heme/copper-type cytochrome/quinol oxidase subunit 4
MLPAFALIEHGSIQARHLGFLLEIDLTKLPTTVMTF